MGEPMSISFSDEVVELFSASLPFNSRLVGARKAPDPLLGEWSSEGSIAFAKKLPGPFVANESLNKLEKRKFYQKQEME